MPKLLQGVGKIGMCLCDLWVKQDAKIVALHALLVLPKVIVCGPHEQQVVGAVGIHCLNLHTIVTSNSADRTSHQTHMRMTNEQRTNELKPRPLPTGHDAYTRFLCAWTLARVLRRCYLADSAITQREPRPHPPTLIAHETSTSKSNLAEQNLIQKGTESGRTCWHSASTAG